MAPAPTSVEVAIAGGGGAGQTTTAPSAKIKFTYDRTTGELRYEATASGLSASDRVLALTLHRKEGDKPGPVVAHLLAPNQISGSGTLVMRGRNREDLVSGGLLVAFYTRQSPLGVGRREIGFP